MGDYQTAYLVGIGIWFSSWLLMYFLRKDLRREMLVMSFGISWLGITQLLYLNDYWTPQYLLPLPYTPIGLEDFLITFMYGGLAGVAYEFGMKKRLVCDTREPLISRLANVALLALPGVALFFILEYATDLNIIYTSTLGLAAVALAYIAKRPHLTVPVLFNGLCLAALAVGVIAFLNVLYPHFVESVWNLEALSGIMILGAPVEEFFFHFAVGCAFALIYEVQRHCRVVPLRGRSRFNFS